MQGGFSPSELHFYIMREVALGLQGGIAMIIEQQNEQQNGYIALIQALK
jgi:hypothetical protein